MGSFADALRFLTWLPLPGSHARTGPADTIALFPLVGFVLGLILAVVDWLLGFAGLPIEGRSVLDVVALVLLTRGMHLDGLMDSCDGLLGGKNPEERLMIMRDSRVGSYAVIGCLCVLLLKIGFLGALDGVERTVALLITPVLGRWGIVLAAAIFRPARPDGMGAQFRAGATKARIAVAAATTLLIAGIIAGPIGLLAVAAVCCGVWLVGNGITESVGGLTGDSFGLVAEAAEVVALLFLALAR